MILPATLIFGLIIGSFLSVCIYRIPASRDFYQEPDQKDLTEQREESRIGITSPARSFCSHCKNQLFWYHNIPVLSWVFLRGKCSFCQHTISARYPLVELLTGFLAVLCLQVYGMTPTGFLIFAFCCALLVISFIDYDFYIIPNIISLPGFVLGLVVALLNQFTFLFTFPVSASITEALWGTLAGAGFLFLVSEVYLRLRKKEGLGMGDVKLLAMTGAFFGPEAALYTIFVGSLLGSVIGLALYLIAGRKMSQQLPFGPYLALGTLLYLFCGNSLVLWALNSIAGNPGAKPF